MDLPLHPSTDIYQIHRTPFFRRLHRKDSDEFERLKQAYESVRNFDEKPLEAQVKKIRLGKLLRRIKDSFTRLNRQKKPRIRAKTQQQLRREELERARQLGIEYSRRNLNSDVRDLCSTDRQDHSKEAKKEKYRLERRLEYGNAISQLNRTKIQRAQTLQSQRSNECQQSHLRESQTTPTSKKRLQALKRRLTREEFINFLVHCLSADQLNAESIRTFKEVLQTRGDMYWDLVEAIDEKQQYIKPYVKFLRKLSKLALRGVPEMKQEKSNFDECVETFVSKTSIRPNGCHSPEVCIRTYRYSDDDEFLPPPSISLLQFNEDAAALLSVSDSTRTFKLECKSAPETSHIPKRSSSDLSTKIMKTIRTDPSSKHTLSHKFGDIIRDAVRKESAAMLHNLERAIKH